MCGMSYHRVLPHALDMPHVGVSEILTIGDELIMSIPLYMPELGVGVKRDSTDKKL